MNNYSLVNRVVQTGYKPCNNGSKHFCLEIFIEHRMLIYQFPVWDIESTCMFILIKEDSDLLRWLRAGDQLDIKYYSNELMSPSKNMVTEIRNISKQEVGRFRGHYLVKLKAIREQDQNTPCALKVETRPNLKMASM